MSPDPAGFGAVDFTNPQTLNRYAYVMNNPLGNVDQTGMDGQSTSGCGWSPLCYIAAGLNWVFGKAAGGPDGADWSGYDCSGLGFCGHNFFQNGGYEVTTTISYGGEGGGGSSGGGGGGTAGSASGSSAAPGSGNSAAPPTAGNRPCGNVNPRSLDFTTPRYYGGEGRTVPPYQHILERHVLPNSKPGTTRYVFGNNLTGVKSPAQTMTEAAQAQRTDRRGPQRDSLRIRLSLFLPEHRSPNELHLQREWPVGGE